MIELTHITTEQVNQQSRGIDQMSTLDMLGIINEEDQKVALAVREILPDIARAVDAISERYRQGGRLIYLGSGSSGRMGVLDAAECPPTYGTDPAEIFAIMAGGKDAVFVAVEGAEDQGIEAIKDLEEINLTSLDSLVGIAASGRTPYVMEAIDYAKRKGALTIGLTAVAGSPLALATDIALTPQTGAEVVTGSTRMKSGTAQKLVLNMLSTALMIKQGKVYGNLMVDLKATNEKLYARAHRMLQNITGCSDEEAKELLIAAQMHVKLAIVMYWHNLNADEAKQALDKVDGHLVKLEPNRESLKLKRNLEVKNDA